MTVTTNNEMETEQLAERYAAGLRRGDAVALYGGLGAGKTAFVRGMARGLGFAGRVTSPTFSIVHEYVGTIPLYHFDFYRLSGVDGLEETGWYHYLEQDGIVVCEWSENIESALPDGCKRVKIYAPDNHPEIRIIEMEDADAAAGT